MAAHLMFAMPPRAEVATIPTANLRILRAIALLPSPKFFLRGFVEFDDIYTLGKKDTRKVHFYRFDSGRRSLGRPSGMSIVHHKEKAT